MIATSPNDVQTSLSTDTDRIALTDVGVRYTLLTDEQRTLKGRILNLLSPTPAPSAEFWALQNITLQIDRGEIVGVIGRNGSGKSTLLRVMCRVIEPTVGSVSVQGDVSPLLELGAAFNLELTGRENAYLYGAMFKQNRERMDELIPKIVAFAELGSFFDVPIKAYSSGMVARLAFSVATQLRPDILLVDEVLSVGDESFQKKCLFRIRKLIDAGSIVVLVSHDSNLIGQLCSRAIYLSKGEIVEDGNSRTVTACYQRDSASNF
jgi:lipopolysaccharide transport system ATP-binding protein